jgi:hypothetical protein
MLRKELQTDYSTFDNDRCQKQSLISGASAGFLLLGFSLPNATVLYGSKAYISNKSRNKVKSSNKEIINLRWITKTPCYTRKTKVITASINKIYTENRNILGAELEKSKLYTGRT